MVHFVGAGSGAVDLITVRGKRILEEADVIIYAGSLVNPELLNYAKEGAEIHNSAKLHLDQVIDIMENAHEKKQMICRLHTGDPSVYGAIREQMDALKEREIPYALTPGVSSVFGAAASLEAEYTLPGVTQTLIITRQAGRTPVPEEEKISSLAKHNATMAIFLSASLTEEVQSELLEGYAPETPVALVYKATWPDERIVYTRVDELAETAKRENITKTALILVGDFLQDTYNKSLLYDPSFTTEFREAVK